MQTTKPKDRTPSVVLVARPRPSGRSKSITLYNTTPGEVMGRFRQFLDSVEEQDRRRKPVPG